MDAQLSRSGPEDRRAVEEFLRERVSLRVARRGELVDALDHPAVLAWSSGRLVGVATYVVDGDDCEVLTLHAASRLTGTGTALLSSVQDIAREAGCARLWLVTTNDNVEAIRFYQRRGFRLTALRPGAVDSSRQSLKPEIPSSGFFGIPLRDELELELVITGPTSG